MPRSVDEPNLREQKQKQHGLAEAVYSFSLLSRKYTQLQNGPCRLERDGIANLTPHLTREPQIAT